MCINKNTYCESKNSHSLTSFFGRHVWRHECIIDFSLASKIVGQTAKGKGFAYLVIANTPYSHIYIWIAWRLNCELQLKTTQTQIYTN